MDITNTASAGRKQKQDVFVTISGNMTGNIIEVTSDVSTLFEKEIIKSAEMILAKYDIKNCHLTIEDHNALDYAIKARVEAAVLISINGDQ